MRFNKKFLALTLCIAVILSALSVFVSAVGEFLPVFSITVNGVTFDSDTDSSGNGWSYSSADRALTLDAYNGSSVISSGDLKVYLKNNNVITGTEKDTYSPESCGIYAKETLELYVSGEATISGADSASGKGGEAIISANTYIYSDGDSAITLYGGEKASAIKADALTVDSSSITVIGGKNASAIYYSSSFDITDNTEAMFVSGSEDRYAVTYLSDAEKLDYSSDNMAVVFEKNSSTVIFKAKSDIIYGDIDLSGTPDSKDAVLLAQFFAHWDVDFTAGSFASADVCLDGTVDSKDAVRLAQFFAKWDVKLGE
ncbi:MAG: hypothetical protein E7623_01775 [Ruminococcaceae bacterium]|nr:hypothetical protein [Oscillospiraceae bacterium]